MIRERAAAAGKTVSRYVLELALADDPDRHPLVLTEEEQAALNSWCRAAQSRRVIPSPVIRIPALVEARTEATTPADRERGRTMGRAGRKMQMEERVRAAGMAVITVARICDMRLWLGCQECCTADFRNDG